MSQKLTTEEFIKKARDVHGDKYDYSKVEYVNNQTKVCIICKEHGEFWQRPLDHLKGHECSECGKIKNVESRKKTLEQFIDEARKVHGGKYDYSNVKYDNTSTKVCIICKEHGEFWQTPEKHLSGCGCPKCGGTKKYTTEEFIEELRKIHGDKYDYSKVEYINSHTKVCILCKEHGKFYTTPNGLLIGHGCPSCAHKNSKAEKEIVQYIKDNTNLTVKENVRGILSNNKELDIYIPEKMFAIEYNGMRWHSEMYNTDKNSHLNKLEECNKLGIKLIQIFETEYLINKKIVYSKILHSLGFNLCSEKVFARRTNIKEISMNIARSFLLQNHIQGFTKSSVYIGCFYENELVGVMSFKRETKDSDKWELTRFATDVNKHCIGIGGKLFKYFIRKYNPIEVKSFADRRWTVNKDNNLYTKIGFKLEEILKPDYRYTKKSTDYIHKFNFRKQKLNRKYGLPLTMTENEMTKEIGYYRIWDCGLLKYKWYKDNDCHETSNTEESTEKQQKDSKKRENNTKKE